MTQQPLPPAPRDPRDAPAWAQPRWREAPAVRQTLPALLAHAVQRFRDHEYIVWDDARIGFRGVLEQSTQLALRLLACGVGKGMRVGMVFPNTPDFVVTWMALARIGAVIVPISTLSTAAELQRIARHADLCVLMVVDRFLNHDYVARIEAAFPSLDKARRQQFLREAPQLRSLWVHGADVPAWAHDLADASPPQVDAAILEQIEQDISPADPVTVVYTSGSTGDPKGVIHSHGTLVRQAGKLFGAYGYQEDDRIFSPQPFFWVGGLMLHMLQMLYVGGTVIGSARATPELLDIIERERVTYVHVYPHAAQAMANDPSFGRRDFSRIRGGRLVQAIPPHLRPKNQYYGNTLGMTETAGPHGIAYRDLPDEFKGSFGPPAPGMEYLIVDVETREPVGDGVSGELLVRGDCLMLGMVKREREEVFTRDGWYATGDLCALRSGWLFFHGRVDDMIKSAGANVSPREVEEVLSAAPGIAQAYACGVPDAARGSVVGAIVVPHAGAHVDLAQLQAHARAFLSSYKVPRVLLVKDAAQVPMTSSTKADRRAIARLLAQAQAAGAIQR